MKDFAEHLKEHGVRFDLAPLETPYLIGKAEKHGGVWKELWRRTVVECDVKGLEDVSSTTAIVTQTKNEVGKHNGYAPNQWVLGSTGIRIPGGLLSGDEDQRLEIIEA
eukprot:1510910-Lingulodinium_polyedra.AAC.1